MAEAGSITDEGIARLRARIGIPEPHPQPPHYLRPDTDAFRHVAIAYGDDNPLWCSPAYAAGTRWEGPIAPPPLVGGDTLVGEDEVEAVRAEHVELMKGDPLRGVHAFYSASSREWWAPLRPGRRRAGAATPSSVSCDKPSEFAGRAVHEWTAQVFRDEADTVLSGQYRLMIRTDRTKARERKKYDDVAIAPYTDAEIDAIDAQYAAEGPRGPAAVVGGRRGRRRRRTHGQGPLDRHRHGVLARGDGDGPLRRGTAAPRMAQPPAHPPVLPS